MHVKRLALPSRQYLNRRILLPDPAHSMVICFDILPGLHPFDHLLLYFSFGFDGFQIKSVLFHAIFQQPLID